MIEKKTTFEAKRHQFDMYGTITFNAQAGTADYYSKKYVVGKKYGTLPKAYPSDASLTFSGWKNSNDEYVTKDSIMAKSEEFKAQYASAFITVDTDSGKWVNPPTKWTNTDTDFVVYESNMHTDDSYTYITLTTSGITELTIYINSYSESNYDYAVALPANSTYSADPGSTSDIAETTKGYSYDPSSTSITGAAWKAVNYTLDGGTNTIKIGYRKDSSAASNFDCSYVAIPSQYIRT